MTIIERLERLGLQISAKDGMILLHRNLSVLTEEWKGWIKAHKPAILRELRDRVAARLGVLAKTHHVPLDDLLDWYRDDIEHMTRIDDEGLAWLVRDYVKFRSFYRRESRTLASGIGG